MPRDLTPVAVLQRQHHITRPSGEGNCGNDPMLLRLRQPTNECNATGSADGSARSLTAGATCFEHHVTQHDDAVSQSSAKRSVQRDARGACGQYSRRRDTAGKDTSDETPGDQDPGNEELDLIRQGVHPLNVS